MTSHAFVSTLIALIGIAFLADTANSQEASRPYAKYNPTVGQVHSDFSLPSIEDKKLIRLADFRGQKLLLLHFASW